MNASGVGFYILKNIKLHALSNIPPLSNDCESLWLEILTNQGNFVLAVVYRHPVSNHTLFREMFLNTTRYPSEHKHLYYICGYFNINLSNFEVESNIKYYVNSLISLSCKLLISKTTRVSGHSATIIDHMYTNDNKHDILSGIPMYEISDHLPIFGRMTCLHVAFLCDIA